MELGLAQLIAVYAIPAILAITLHEAAHALVASYLGDSTARSLGRVTANPVRHVDPIGTLLVPLLILLVSKGGMIFGWAKPVPVIASNLRTPVRDMGLVAAAGPGANLLMAVAWALLLKLAIASGFGEEFVVRMAYAGIVVNLVLAVLNLMPVPPLDGGRILTSLLPERLAAPYARLEPYGLFILLALLATGVLGGIIGPLVGAGLDGLLTLFVLN
ncbi:MAG: site-2 protease family protein [Limnobacter sp.]|nr:site-2 protease family protein [Limnobacter sp.]